MLNAGDYGKVMVSDAGSSLDFLNGGLECNAVLSDCAGTVYRFGDCSLTSLNDCEKIYGTESENDNSIVLLLRYGDYSILFTGDVTSEREEMLAERVAECGVEHVSLLKAAHHGSRYSTSSDFYRASDRERLSYPAPPKILTVILTVRRSSGSMHPGRRCTEWMRAVP